MRPSQMVGTENTPRRVSSPARLEALCNCALRMGYLEQGCLSQWLEGALRLMAGATTGQLGLAVLVGKWDESATAWKLVAAARQGMTFEAGPCPWRLADCWPNDDLSVEAGHASNPPTSGLVRLTDLLSRLELKHRQHSAGNGRPGRGVARWLGVMERPSVPEAVLIQVEDAVDPAGPSELALNELVALAPQLLRAYERRFILPETRRAAVWSRLTPMQQCVAGLLLRGRNQEEIAQELGRTYHTVHGHVKEIYDRLQVHSSDQLALLLEGRTLDPGTVPEIERRH